MRKYAWLLAASTLALPVHAAVVLKQSGAGESGFRVKTVRAKVRIENGVATTHLVWAFAESQRRWKPEVEFFYGAPPRGVVTFFAYWFRGERVVARVAEKEKAASIYNQLSQWGVDPALVELDGNNTFRARIFPVEANQDVRVEMHLVQPLEATPNGQKWTLPLSQKFVSPRRLSKWLPVAKASAPFYDEVQIEVESREKGSVNFPGAKFSGGKWRFSARNVAANRDFGLEWSRPKPPLRADLFSSRASGRTGYFSLLLTPSQALKRPRLQISGVAVSDVFPARIPDVKAGENVLICGRYRGAGTATVSLTGETGTESGTVSSRVNFSSRLGANNPAAKLWAARQIAALGANEANRSRVISLSKRWNLPSAQTSWLAVPKAEKANFDLTKQAAEMRNLARQIASDLVLGRAASAKVHRAKLRVISDRNLGGGTPESFTREQIDDALRDLTSNLARAHQMESLEIRPDARKLRQLRAQLERAIAVSHKREAGVNDPLPPVSRILRSTREQLSYERQLKLAPLYVEAVLNHGRDSAQAVELKKQFDKFGNLDENNAGYGPDLLGSTFYSELRLPLHQLAYEKLREEERLNPNRTKISEINADMERLLALANVRYRNQFTEWQQHAARRDATEELLAAYAAEAQKAAPDNAQLQALHQRVGELVPQNPLDAPEIKAAQKSGDKRELLAQIDRKKQFFARPGDPLIEVNAPADCLQVIAVLPSGEIKKLVFNAASKKWEVRFDVPGYAAQGTYRIQILIVEKSGARRNLTLGFGVDTLAPTAQVLRSNAGQLQLETDAQTDRVSAFTPWNARLELRRDEKGLFSAPLDVPAAWRGQKLRIRFVVTDKAHNRTEILVDWN